MASIHAYLNFNGNTEEVFNFYQSVFGGEFITFQRFKDIPGQNDMPADALDKIMHVSMPIGENTVLMGSDAVESMNQSVTMGNNIHLSIDSKSPEEAEHLFNGLSQGGKVTMPLQKTFWGAYFGMFQDQFGINWMVNHDFEEKN
ncbi:VOC family protein [Nibribacter ruber]|uniref:VOC family protein n=1 Tax=Nibribacter ruber TaxID=2698458 RepID=A0A6P1NWX5_9BACT|nr:VOC family protein [Nibribacter ruber]QHL86709.1 VOC family protein [Nibribacter ruber]